MKEISCWLYSDSYMMGLGLVIHSFERNKTLFICCNLLIMDSLKPLQDRSYYIMWYHPKGEMGGRYKTRRGHWNFICAP